MYQLRKCSQCGKTVYNTADHAYCMYCGEPLEDSLSINEETIEDFSPCKKQYIAALLLVLAIILNNSLVKGLLAASDWVKTDTVDLLPSLISSVFYLGGLLILCKVASNKASRIATYVLMGSIVISMSHSLLMYAALNEVIGCYILLAIFPVISIICFIYAISLVAQNNYLSWNSRIWINILPITTMSFPILFFAGISASSLINGEFISVYLYAVWSFILSILEIVAVTKLALCEAFSGKYDSLSIGNYMPFNKYMAAMLVTPTVIMLAVYLFVKYGTQFI